MDDKSRVALVDTPTVNNSGTTESQLLRYQFSNHLGSATLELDYTAAIISYEEYYPFGNTSFQSGRSTAEVSLKRYRYTGKEKDDETGLYYYGARYYAPWLCRWIAADPINLLFKNYAESVQGNNGSLDFQKNLQSHIFNVLPHKYSQYCYSSNNPIVMKDNDGMLDIIIHIVTIEPNGKKSERTETKHYETGEDLKGIDRTPVEIDVTAKYVQEKSGNATFNVWTPQSYKVREGTGETKGEKMKRENLTAYVLSKIMIANPLGTGQFMVASQERDFYTGEYQSKFKKISSAISGLFSLATFGTASSMSGFIKGWAIDLAVEFGIDEVGGKAVANLVTTIAQKLNFNTTEEAAKKTEMILWSIYRISKDKDAKSFENFVEKLSTAVGGAKSAAELSDVLRDNGIDTNAPLDKDEAIKKSLQETVGNVKEKK
jgi:RHS repeat-associated protein